MNINIKKVHIGSINQEVNQSFKSGDAIVFLGRATVTEARFKDNFDGSVNATYMASPEISDIRLSEGSESVVDTYKLKQKSESQALRHKAFVVAQNKGLSEKELYSEAIGKGHEFLDNLLNER